MAAVGLSNGAAFLFSFLAGRAYMMRMGASVVRAKGKQRDVLRRKKIEKKSCGAPIGLTVSASGFYHTRQGQRCVLETRRKARELR